MPDLPGPMRTRLDAILADHRALEGPLLPILHAIQAEWGHVPADTLPVVAEALNLSRAEVHGTVTFYHDFRDTPPPRHVIRLCRAEACQAQGGRDLEAELRAALARRADVAIEAVYCLGLCACGPAAMVNDELLGRTDSAAITAKVAP